jgi:hypothetical protein
VSGFAVLLTAKQAGGTCVVIYDGKEEPGIRAGS